ncbi:protein of unknown function [Kyrpidia spormannii]|uniref:Uncharacterized protein n=1 Tax=Kyrpidia spormannii TaxID=2055160 RepID=A0A6F9EII5_9BACL|nr:protein of unknown function [Kyrpidia spormannii]
MTVGEPFRIKDVLRRPIFQEAKVVAGGTRHTAPGTMGARSGGQRCRGFAARRRTHPDHRGRPRPE